MHGQGLRLRLVEVPEVLEAGGAPDGLGDGVVTPAGAGHGDVAVVPDPRETPTGRR